MYQKRPGIITLLAIMHLVVGGCGLLIMVMSGLFNLVHLIQPPTETNNWGGPNAPNIEFFMDQHLDNAVPLRFEMNLLGHLLSTAGFASLIIISFGLLRLRRWAWTASLLYAVGILLYTLIYLAYEFGLILPAMDSFIRSEKSLNVDPEMGIWDSTSIRLLHFVCICTMSCIGLYPLFVLCVLFLPSSLAIFRGDEEFALRRWHRKHDEEDAEDDDD